MKIPDAWEMLTDGDSRREGKAEYIAQRRLKSDGSLSDEHIVLMGMPLKPGENFDDEYVQKGEFILCTEQLLNRDDVVDKALVLRKRQREATGEKRVVLCLGPMNCEHYETKTAHISLVRLTSNSLFSRPML